MSSIPPPMHPKVTGMNSTSYPYRPSLICHTCPLFILVCYCGMWSFSRWFFAFDPQIPSASRLCHSPKLFVLHVYHIASSAIMLFPLPHITRSMFSRLLYLVVYFIPTNNLRPGANSPHDLQLSPAYNPWFFFYALVSAICSCILTAELTFWGWCCFSTMWDFPV